MGSNTFAVDGMYGFLISGLGVGLEVLSLGREGSQGLVSYSSFFGVWRFSGLGCYMEFLDLLE